MAETIPLPPGEPPRWLDTATRHAMLNARNRALAWGRGAYGAAEAAREVALAHCPALPLPMIAEAVAAVVPDPQPGGGAGPVVGDLLPVAEADLAQALAFVMRFDAVGRPRRTSYEHLAPLAAAQLVQQLARSGYDFMQKPPVERHTTGGGGR